jgi:hypothetical protein
MEMILGRGTGRETQGTGTRYLGQNVSLSDLNNFCSCNMKFFLENMLINICNAKSLWITLIFVISYPPGRNSHIPSQYSVLDVMSASNACGV